MPNWVAALIRSTVFLLALSSPAAAAEEFIPRAQDKPPGPALSPQDAMAKMQLPEGFKVELVAAEPDVVNPTAFTFDDRGRIWVTESVEYPRKEPGKGKDRVKVLEDTDGDGRVDKATVFKDGLNIPCGIAHGNGGVYVTNAPDVLFLRDTDGDDKADTEEVLFTGFGRDDTHELPNTLIWGPDGWLYGMNGVFNPSKVKDPATGQVFEFTCAVWRYHPKNRRFEIFAEGTSNPWGLDYNRQGDWFLSCCVIDHLFHITQSGYYVRQGGPYPPMTVPLGSITTQNHQKAAYAGLVHYDADVYPEPYRGKLLMGNLHGSCINQDKLDRNGSTYRQTNDPDFLSANDAWFMPVSQKLGPDGCVYVMDWYDRYHCYQDANRDSPGLDRLKGRIYRVTYNDTPLAKPFDLGKSSKEDLIKLLGHPNAWWRRTAQRLLNEQFDDSLTPRLQEMALDTSDATPARTHALWLLASQGAFQEAFHLKVLASKDPVTRNWGVRAAGQMLDISPGAYERIKAMAADEPSPDVRVQIPIAAGRITNPDPLPILLAMLLNPKNADDPLIPNILYQNLKPHAPLRGREILKFLDANPDVSKSFGATTERWIREAINATGRKPAEIVADLGKALNSNPDLDRTKEALLNVVGSLEEKGIKREERARLFDPAVREAVTRIATGTTKARPLGVLVALWWDDPAALEAARQIITDRTADSAYRSQLVRALAERRDPADRPAFAALVTDDNAPVRVRLQAIDALGSAGDAKTAEVLTRAYATLPTDLKPAVLGVLTRSPASAVVLLDALEQKQVPLADVTANHVRQIQSLGNEFLIKRVAGTWGTVKTERDPERVKIVEQYRQIVKQHQGDPVAGWKVFEVRCAQCHTIYGKGGNVGPDLTGVGRQDLDAVLTNVIDPNLVIGKPYYVHLARKKNGTVFSGLLVEESDQRIVLRDQTKQETIPRDQLDKMVLQNISVMPEGLEKTMTEPEFAHLVAFLLTKEPPGGPREPEAGK